MLYVDVVDILVLDVAKPVKAVVPVGAVSPVRVGAVIVPLLTLVPAALVLVHLKYVVCVPLAVLLAVVPFALFV